MDRSSYLSGVAELYTGEVLGEGLTSRWLERLSDPHQTYAMSLFLQLESEAKVKLRPFLARLGLSLVEQDRARAEGAAYAERFLAQPWHVAMSDLANLSRHYINLHSDVLKAAPKEDVAIVRFMVQHEEALVRFAERESRHDESAVDELLPLLTNPIGPPHQRR